jgi:hypothetical protein
MSTNFADIREWHARSLAHSATEPTDPDDPMGGFGPSDLEALVDDVGLLLAEVDRLTRALRLARQPCDLCAEERPGEVYDAEHDAWVLASCDCKKKEDDNVTA